MNVMGLRRTTSSLPFDARVHSPLNFARNASASWPAGITTPVSELEYSAGSAHRISRPQARTALRVARPYGVRGVLKAFENERVFFRAVLDGKLGYALYWGRRPTAAGAGA